MGWTHSLGSFPTWPVWILVPGTCVQVWSVEEIAGTVPVVRIAMRMVSASHRVNASPIAVINCAVPMAAVVAAEAVRPVNIVPHPLAVSIKQYVRRTVQERNAGTGAAVSRADSAALTKAANTITHVYKKAVAQSIALGNRVEATGAAECAVHAHPRRAATIITNASLNRAAPLIVPAKSVAVMDVAEPAVPAQPEEAVRFRAHVSALVTASQLALAFSVAGMVVEEPAVPAP